MKIETDFGLIIEAVSGSGVEKLDITDENNDTITINSDQYVELVKSVKLMLPDWNDDI
jgi:hypothetical protein